MTAGTFLFAQLGPVDAPVWVLPAFVAGCVVLAALLIARATR